MFNFIWDIFCIFFGKPRRYSTTEMCFHRVLQLCSPISSRSSNYEQDTFGPPSRHRMVISCKILQDSGKILQDDTSSCKIFFQNLARSCKITLCLARILQDNHSSCKYANKWNMIEQDQNETRTMLPVNCFTL